MITANHIEMVLVNLGDEIIKKDRIRLKFTAELFYCTEVAQKVKTFLEGELAKDTLLGIGVAIPGIIDQKERIVLKSHALGIENYSLRFLEQALEIPVYFENDANAAMLMPFHWMLPPDFSMIPICTTGSSEIGRAHV